MDYKKAWEELRGMLSTDAKYHESFEGLKEITPTTKRHHEAAALICNHFLDITTRLEQDGEEGGIMKLSEVVEWAKHEESMWQREVDCNMRVGEREYARGCVASLNQFLEKLKQVDNECGKREDVTCGDLRESKNDR